MNERRTAPSLGEWVLLVGIVAAGLALRAFRLRWGLPYFTFPDAFVHFIRPAARAAAGGPLIPDEFVHPTGVFFLLTGAFRAWSVATGQPIIVGPGAALQIPTLELVGRYVMLAAAGLTLLALWVLGRRILTPRAALLGTAVFALAPLHVLESHRIAPDVPMLLVAVLAVWLAVSGGWGRLIAAFGAAGLATAVKYPGAFAATAPAWLVMRASRRWLAVLVVCGLVAVLGFALGCIPCFCRFDAFVRGMRLISSYGYVIGMPGVDLSGRFPQQRWVYPLVVALPYMLGWPVYLAALAGLVVLWRSDRAAAGLLLAATVPYLAFMGGAISAVPRYYLLLSPFLALAAGAALDRFSTRALGAVVTVAVLGYTAALSVSQVMRLGLGPQRAVAAVVAERAATVGKRRFVVAYPNQFARAYDAVTPLIRGPRVDIVEFPEPYGHLGGDTEAAETAPTTDLRAWLRTVDVVVLPSWAEDAVLRTRPDGYAARFFRELEDGSLGFRSAGVFETRYVTEPLYTWGDPMLDTHWETAIAGYKVFVPASGGAPG